MKWWSVGVERRKIGGRGGREGGKGRGVELQGAKLISPNRTVFSFKSKESYMYYFYHSKLDRIFLKCPLV